MSDEFERCSSCVLSASFPRISFDANGVCNFCRNELLFTTEKEVVEQSRVKALSLFEELSGTSEYDAVVCYSGGKDSTYTLMQAVQKYDLKVLALTIDNGFLSPFAFDNIHRAVDALGVDLMIIKPSAKFFVPLVKVSAFHSIYNPATLTRISSVCNSCISIVNTTALKIALEKRIPFILAGFTLGQIPANAIIYKNNYTFLQESRRPVLEKLREHLGKNADDYFTLNDELVKRIKDYPSTINLLCLEDITEEQIVKDIEKLGWVKPKDVDGCSSNCRLNGFNNFIHVKKFGFNPYELELSHLIRRGKITREEALEKIKQQLDVESFKQVLEQLEVSEDELVNPFPAKDIKKG